MKKLYLLMPVILLTACNSGNYVKCKRLTIGDKTYQSSEPIIYKVGKFKLNDESIDLPSKYKEGEETFIYAALMRFDSYTEEVNFTETAKVRTDSVSSTATLAYIIGEYKSYNAVYYSKDKKSIKYEEVKFEKVSGSKDKEIQGKSVYTAAISNDEYKNTEISYYGSSSGYYGSVYTLKTSTLTTYIDTGDSNVTYTIES